MNQINLFVKNILCFPINKIYIIGKMRSWDNAELAYQTIYSMVKLERQLELAKSVQILLSELRKNGFDKKLYAQVSLWDLKVSKTSFSYNTPSKGLMLSWIDGGICIRHNGIIALQLPKCEYSPELESFLEEFIRS